MCEVLSPRVAEVIEKNKDNNNNYADIVNNTNTTATVSPNEGINNKVIPNDENNNNYNNKDNSNNGNIHSSDSISISNNAKTTSLTLHDIICDNGFYVLFNNYLQRIHAQESLEFWIEVEIFKRVTSERECVKMAQAIYKRFIDDASTTEINVDSCIREELCLKLNNNMYDTDLYDKAQECVESTLKFSCLRVFIDDILPKELRRKSIQPENSASDKHRKSLLQRFTSSSGAPNRAVKKYREIKSKEDKYIKSITAGRKKKKRDTVATDIASTKNNDKRLSEGYSSSGSSDTDSDSFTDLPKSNKLFPRRSNPTKPLKVSVDSGDEREKRGCMSDGEATPRVVTPKSDLPRKATKSAIANQRSSSTLFGFNFMGVPLSPTDFSPISKCASGELSRSLSPTNSPMLRNMFGGYNQEEEERKKLWVSQ